MPIKSIQVQALRNGNIGLLYEYGINNPYEKIGFIIIPFEQLKK